MNCWYQSVQLFVILVLLPFNSCHSQEEYKYTQYITLPDLRILFWCAAAGRSIMYESLLCSSWWWTLSQRWSLNNLLPTESVTPNLLRVVIAISLILLEILIGNPLLRGQSGFLSSTGPCVLAYAIETLLWIRKCLSSYRKCDTCPLWWAAELLCSDKRLQAVHFIPSGSVWVPVPISCSSPMWQTEPGELVWSEEGRELLWDPRLACLSPSLWINSG